MGSFSNGWAESLLLQKLREYETTRNRGDSSVDHMPLAHGRRSLHLSPPVGPPPVVVGQPKSWQIRSNNLTNKLAARVCWRVRINRTRGQLIVWPKETDGYFNRESIRSLKEFKYNTSREAISYKLGLLVQGSGLHEKGQTLSNSCGTFSGLG